MKTTIFFDVDGVLNKESDWTYKFSVNKKCVLAFAEFIEKLRKRSEVKLVICSTWRAGISTCGDDSKQMQNLENVMDSCKLKISDSTPLSNKGRQAEIEYYLHRYPADNYMVIDDDPSLFENPDKINLYSPDYKTGFTKSDVKAALKKFKEVCR